MSGRIYQNVAARTKEKVYNMLFMVWRCGTNRLKTGGGARGDRLEDPHIFIAVTRRDTIRNEVRDSSGCVVKT